MQLKAYASCRSNEGWQAVRIPSTSTPDVFYTVLVSPWKVDESICDCPNFMYRGGRCKHQALANSKVCRWTEQGVVGSDPSGVSVMPNVEGAKVCPKCGGPTKYEVEVVNG